MVTDRTVVDGVTVVVPSVGGDVLVLSVTFSICASSQGHRTHRETRLRGLLVQTFSQTIGVKSGLRAQRSSAHLPHSNDQLKSTTSNNRETDQEESHIFYRLQG